MATNFRVKKGILTGVEDRSIGSVTIAQAFVPERTIVENIRRMHELLMRRALEGAQAVANDIERTMKNDAPWEDQDGSGRSDLKGDKRRMHKPPRYPGPSARQGLFAAANRNGDVITIQAGFTPDVIHRTAAGKEYHYPIKLEENEDTAVVRPTFESKAMQDPIRWLTGGGRNIRFSGPIAKRPL